MGVTLSQNFPAAAEGNAFGVMPGDSLTYSVSGTYTGLMVFERTRNNGASWEPVLSGSSGQAFGGTVENLSGMEERYRWRSYVLSGTAVAVIADVDGVVHRYLNAEGVPRMEVTDDGVRFHGTLTVVEA